MRLLYVRKHNPQDPTDLAYCSWLPREIPGTAVFTFAPDERSRSSSSRDTALRRFLSFVRCHGTTHVLSWGLYLNPAEVHWLRRHGIKVVGAVNGISGLHHGYIRDQAEYLDYLRAHDLFFTPHAPHVEPLRSRGVQAAELPFCFDEDVYRPLAAHGLLTTLGRAEGIYIGNFGPPSIAQGRYRAAVVRELARAFRMLVVCDARYREYDLGGARRVPTVTSQAALNFLMNCANFTVGTDAFPELDLYYQGSATNVTLPYDRERDAFVMRPRTVWSMGTGLPFVVDDYPEIRRYFRDGEEIVLWRDPAHAVERLRALAKEPGKLTAIGVNGRVKALRLHSASVRCRQLRAILETGRIPDFSVG